MLRRKTPAHLKQNGKLSLNIVMADNLVVCLMQSIN